jgi:hypothetical protein
MQDARRRAAVRDAWGARVDAQDWDDADAVLPIGEAAERGYAAIDQLGAQHNVSPVIAARGKELIKFLFKANTVDSAISPDDDGLSFYWAAQEMSLTILVYRSCYWWSVRNIAGDSYSDEGAHLPLTHLEHSLNQFSKEVERRNPHWRSLIR